MTKNPKPWEVISEALKAQGRSNPEACAVLNDHRADLGDVLLDAMVKGFDENPFPVWRPFSRRAWNDGMRHASFTVNLKTVMWRRIAVKMRSPRKVTREG